MARYVVLLYCSGWAEIPRVRLGSPASASPVSGTASVYSCTFSLLKAKLTSPLVSLPVLPPFLPSPHPV